MWKDHQRIDFPNNPTERSVYSADLIHKTAMDYLRAQTAAKPFFMYLPYTLPHADLDVPHDSVYNFYVKAFNEQPDTVTKSTKESHHHDLYPRATMAAMISRLDKFVGEIAKLVDEKGMSKNTLIIFTSDNGPHKEGGNDPDYFNSNGEYKGIKRDLYEGGIREPFVARWPGTIKAGGVYEKPAIMYDLYATFLQMANIKNEKNQDGLSLVGAFTGKPLREHSYLYWELHESGGKQAIRVGKWKGVLLNVSTSQASPLELYDLSVDPHETKNVATQYPDIVKMLLQKIREAYVPNPDWPLLPGEEKTLAN